MLPGVWEGIYNHSEVFYLDTKWDILRFFGAFVHRDDRTSTYEKFPGGGWVEIMPKHNLIRYCVHMGHVTYRYSYFNDVKLNNQPLAIRIKGWRTDAEPIEPDVSKAIEAANAQMFYNDVDKAIS